MRRFFYNSSNVLKVGETLAVTEDIFHHWCKVLRANVGETAIFFDGQQGEFTVTLIEINKKNALVAVEQFAAINRSLPYDVHIGLVMSRGERMDYALQKATEMGVTSVQLLTSERCEVRLKPDQVQKKLEHWQGVTVAACEQCGLNIVPKVLPPIDLATYLLSFNSKFDRVTANESASPVSRVSLNLVLAVLNTTPIHDMTLHRIKDTLASSEPTFNLLIGPEGGLTEAELTAAQTAQFLAWQIGERVLRTETAPVVAIASLQAISSIC